MSLPRLTDAELIVLGMLHERPQHGYDLEKLIKQRGVRNWADIGFSSIYYILDKLENKDCITSEASVGKARKSYTITQSGIIVCKQNTERLLSVRISPKNPFMVGIANSFMLSEAETSELIAVRRKLLTTQLGALAEMQKAQQPIPEHATRLFSYSEAMITAEIQWIDKII